MASLLVTGGTQRKSAAWRGEWHAYERAQILRIDLETGRASVVKDYVSPADVCAPKLPSMVFKAATVLDDTLFVCTQTEVLAYALPSFALVRYVSWPMFNDLHHVLAEEGGRLFIANTGLDQVVEVTPDGGQGRVWSVLGDEPWGRFDPTTDYRRVATTKPHESHPNFVFRIRDGLWVTRFEQRDAVCLTGDGRFDIGRERVHDGVVDGDRVMFTTVDGTVAVFDARSHERLDEVDLNEILPRPAEVELGWCRGLAMLDPDRIAVGFSRVRQTRFRQNLRWMKGVMTGGRLHESLPTRVVVVNTRSRCLEQEYELEDLQVNAVFSIHVRPD